VIAYSYRSGPGRFWKTLNKYSSDKTQLVAYVARNYYRRKTSRVTPLSRSCQCIVARGFRSSDDATWYRLSSCNNDAHVKSRIYAYRPTHRSDERWQVSERGSLHGCITRLTELRVPWARAEAKHASSIFDISPTRQTTIDALVAVTNEWELITATIHIVMCDGCAAAVARYQSQYLRVHILRRAGRREYIHLAYPRFPTSYDERWYTWRTRLDGIDSRRKWRAFWLQYDWQTMMIYNIGDIGVG